MTEVSTSSVNSEEKSIFESNLPLEKKLERARTELLDLSARNRLLNVPRSGKSARVIEIVDELTAEIYRLLVREGRVFTFLAGRAATTTDEGAQHGDADEIAELALPDDDEVDDRGIARRHSDTKLQTRLTPAGLQKRLLDMYYDARTLEEEQGVNILFLALGTLKWVDPTNAANIRYAPLILIPVALERGNAGEKFKLRWRQEDSAANLSLEAYLDRVHGIKLPAFDSSEEFDPSSYIAAIAEAVESKKDWVVAADDMVLGFFSFAKFLMYRDLDPEVWPMNGRITDQGLIRSLLTDGFEAAQDLISEEESIDPHIPAADMLHIVDSDSSQTIAVHEVRKGRDLVIQGPPGTGKSQTIANIIGSAIADGKTVLFVAEKMAALEVVKRRLDATGVGDACLELHSNKANKRLLLEELKRTWELGSPRGEGPSTLNSRITEARDRLNGHAHRMHERHLPSQLTPYQVIGHLARLRQDGIAPNDVKLESPTSWTPDDFKERSALLAELGEKVEELGRPIDHPWCGVDLQMILPTDVERLITRISGIAGRLEVSRNELDELAVGLDLPAPENLAALGGILPLARRVATAPGLSSEAIGSGVWEGPEVLQHLLAVGEQLSRLRTELTPHLRPVAWDADVSEALEDLGRLPPTFGRSDLERVGRIASLLPALIAEGERLAAALGKEAPRTLGEIETTAAIGERVAAAPPASPEAISSDLWDMGTERAGDLADAVSVLQTTRAEVGNQLTEAAWAMDLSSTRTCLASNGTSLFRYFSGEWRRSNRLVKSLLASPNVTLEALLPLLDALARGQAALKTVREDDEFGRRAFGLDWRGDRSTAEPLLALVEWMRSLRALGAEPRLIAARRPDQADVRARSAAVGRLAAEQRALLQEVGDALHGHRSALFGELSFDRVELADLVTRFDATRQADIASGALLVDVPDALAGRLTLLGDLHFAQQLDRQLRDGENTGHEAFGTAWKGTLSDWPSLKDAASWIDGNSDIRRLVSGMPDPRGPAERALRARDSTSLLINDLKSLFSNLNLDVVQVFGREEIPATSFDELVAKFSAWIDAEESLSKWVAYRGRSGHGRSLGLTDPVDRLHDGRITPADILTNFEMSYYEAIYAEQVTHRPELGQFDGASHSRLVQDFIDLDRQRIAASSVEVVRAHHRRIPPINGSPVGPLGTLRGEMARKRGHMPIRQLMQRAAPAIQALKPVFMMSPLSVAQFLPPGGATFDLLVMDEASQIQPVDALGAIARCRQVVVVGDPQQLPPTAFFAKMTGAKDEDDDQDDARVADIESILGLFTARGLPKRMLRWHYRSRHQSLIAVSNKQFYESKLFIVPSPYTAEAGMGLRFHFVANGLFETGGSRTNPVEAKVVAQAVIAHARQHPGLSLGVAAFSAAQRRAIQDQIEILRRQLPPEEESFFQSHLAEPFFIKNLENVQGDERDVIFISVGYGPSTEGGKPAMRFGPLGSEGGERRLNVLISRAKRRCEVFSSITDEDIDPDFAASRKGVFAFKLFLHFARTGQLSMAEVTGRDHDSVFEEQVAKALRDRGYQVHRQVGIAGFFIDLAIGDPDLPGRYLVGIECDGEAYHDSRSARDRDRLRQSVLEDHGWIIHRIWSSDWFQRPKEQLERTVAAIEAAKIELAARASELSSRAVPFEIITVEREDVTEIGLSPSVGVPEPSCLYKEAALIRPAHRYEELHETPTGLLTALAEQVVAVEGPVHVSEVVNRIRDAWGLQRAGTRIQNAVEQAIDVAVKLGRLRKDGPFLTIPDTVPEARDRSEVISASLRRPEMLPPAEIRAAALDIVRRNFGATLDQVIQAIARALGFKSTSSQLRSIIRAVVCATVAEGMLVDQAGLLVPKENGAES